MIRSVSRASQPAYLWVMYILRLVLGAVTLSGAFFFGFHKQAAEMGVYSAVGLVLLAFTFFGELGSLKGGGLELTRLTREAKEVTVEASETIEHLRQVAQLTADLAATTLPRMGRYGSALGALETLEIGRRLKDQLVPMGVARPEVKRVLDTLVSQAWPAARAEFQTFEHHSDVTFQAAEIDLKNVVETYAVTHPFATADFARAEALKRNVWSANVEGAVRHLAQVEYLYNTLFSDL